MAHLPGSRPTLDAVAANRARRARLRRRRRRLVAWWLVAVVVVGGGSFTAGLLAAPVDFTAPPPEKSALLLDAQGRLFATIRSPQMREEVPADKIPPVMRQAIVAAEDENFFTHSGVDPTAIARAAWRDLTGAPLQGGSTITQQYVKDVYVGDKRTFLRKLREAALAFRLEHHLTKQQILTRYLNGLYLGNATYGVQAASKFYFGVPVDHLDLDPKTGRHDPYLALARAATLAGMAPAPSLWNPLADKKAARDRETYTLNRMVANGMISAQQASTALGDALPAYGAHREPALPTVAPEFRDLVERDLRHTYGDTEVDKAGLRVRTTLDLDLQKAAVAALKDVLPAADDPEAAVVAVDPRNGDVKALAQRRSKPYQRGGFVIPTMTARSSGSTIKPFTLAAALGAGHSLDEGRYGPPCLTVQGWHLCNAVDGEAGYFTLKGALVHSVNTIYGPLALDVGLRKVFDVAQKAGLAPASSFEKVFPAKALGVDVTPLSEAVAYSTLVDHGVRHDPRYVLSVGSQDNTLNVHAPSRPSGVRAMSAGVADQVTGAMQDVVDYGTGTAARQPFTVYGKTGTTDNYTNAWFVGCTRSLCIAVWMGYDTPRPMKHVEGVAEVYGGSLPAEVFARTWDHFRALKATAAASATATPQPIVARPQPAAPKTTTPPPTKAAPVRRTASPTPTKTTPPPTVSSSAAPLPTLSQAAPAEPVSSTPTPGPSG